jgi:hypothetical protein
MTELRLEQDRRAEHDRLTGLPVWTRTLAGIVRAAHH